MPDQMNTEQLSPGQRPEGLPVGQFPAGLAEGTAPQLGTNHEANAGVGEVRDLGPADVEQMFGPATTPLEQLRAAGKVDESNPEEMGGGGGVDPVEKYFAGMAGQVNLDKIGQYIESQRQKDLGDGEQITVGGKPLCTFEEYRKIYEAIRAAQAGGDRRPIEEIIREARRPATSPPEPQAAIQPADWRIGLPSEQQQWLAGLQRNLGIDKNRTLLTLQSMIKEIDANPRRLSGNLSAWNGNRSELRVILLRLGEEVQHQFAIENVLKLSSDRQNTGEQIAANFLVELRQTLVGQFPNDLEKQNGSLINLYERLRRDDALGFSPDIGLIPPGADIGILLRVLKSMLGRNGG
ncbi:hypothetical protein HYU89_01410 [Candidatus Collierbacteria bacterium]|nr:hypothetical protein [Candidatus Collierbacteria bacterium]